MPFAKHPSLPPIVHPVDPKSYHSIDAKIARGNPMKTMSQSELKKFAPCPHRWFSGHDEEETDAMRDGALVDIIILTPERFEKEYAIAPEVYPCEPTKKDPRTEKPWNWNATFCADWKELQEAKGLSVVKSGHAADAWKAREVFMSNERLKAFHEGSRKQVQVNVVWEDDETGIVVPIKCLIDLVPDAGTEFDNMLADFKRTNDAEYRKWARTVHSYQLHLQGAFYLDAYNAATGEKRNRFDHHIQEQVNPWEVTHRELSHEFIALGRTSYKSALANYSRALKTGNFYGYDNAMVEPEIWMITA